MSNFKIETDADGIALVTWDMAGRSMNVITMDLIAELGAVVEKIANDAAIKGAVITSGKQAFCGGADLTMLDRMADIFATMVKTQGEQAAAGQLYEESRKLSLLYRRIETCGKPWVAASSLRSHAITALPRTMQRPGLACLRSRSGCSPAPAALNALHACSSPPTRCNSCSRATSSKSIAPKR
jgi:3-hydroxyacyl-CoA dehydrogenase/enoyl-CoA hydratase/3-hydroxybutyryl-CoA epimerase